MAARNPFVKLKFYLTFIKHLFRGPNSFPCGPECVIIIIAAQRGPPGSILWHFCHSDTFATLWRSCNTVTLIPQWHLCNTYNKKYSRVVPSGKTGTGIARQSSCHIGTLRISWGEMLMWSSVVQCGTEIAEENQCDLRSGPHNFTRWSRVSLCEIPGFH